MIFEFDSCKINCDNAYNAACILGEELQTRLVSVGGEKPLCFAFTVDEKIKSKDEYEIVFDGNTLEFRAKTIRGHIFAIGEFLRNSEFNGGKITLVKDISGKYSPCMKIRGHQLGYRDTPNSYDAWSVSDYVRYYKDLMFFGTNTVEHIPYENSESKRNEIMKYDEVELAALAAKEADLLDLDVSLWMPNVEKDFDMAKKHRERVFSVLDRIDAVFPPGGDPGDLDAEEMFERGAAYYEILKKKHPDAKIWPSAQAPRGKENWGERFIAALEQHSEETGGVIQGPNRAFTTDELRRKVPARFPLRFYPDITHNVRCEHPVHFLEDDWNYVLCTVNSRESFNPRPTEYAKLHRLNYKYFIGSVSYSEGVNDDVNKAVFTALDFNPDKPVREIISEYARLFFFGTDTNKVVDGIFGLEKNWEGRPDENPSIDYTFGIFESLGKAYPSLYSNWRYLLCLFRATTDKFAKDKLVFENSLLADAKISIGKGEIAKAEEILKTPLPEETTALRRSLDELAELLYMQIGMQLSVEKYHAKSWERGAVLDVVDLPITDVPVLLGKIRSVKDRTDEEKAAFLNAYISRNKVLNDEYYFSFAFHELYALGVRQTPDFYMDFQGDKPGKNDGTLPVNCFKVFDHFSLKLRTAGFSPDTDYTLMISYCGKPDNNTEKHKITANGHLVYEGRQYGGEQNTDYEKDCLSSGFTAVMYKLPASVFENGCLELEITEPSTGFKLSELRITKAPYKSPLV